MGSDHAHALKRSAVPRKTAIVKSMARSCCDALVPAVTSNGEPPPEAAFESCGTGVRFGAGALVEETAGGATEIDVGFGSTISPCDDELDCAASDDEDDADSPGAEVVVALEADVTSVDEAVCAGASELPVAFDEIGGGGGGCALVFSGAFALLVALTTRGHNAVTPTSSLKTPMILASPRSTSLHTLLTTSPIFFSPATHASVHRAEPLGSKSLALQPWISVVYAARHCALEIVRSWKFASWTADAVLKRAKMDIAMRNEACILW